MMLRHSLYGAVIVFIACAFLDACEKSAGPGGTAQSFPGYQQVAQSGDAAQLWFNDSDIKRTADGYQIHTLKTIPGGYSRFDVLTNCPDTVRRLPGTQYRSDGTANKDYPGNDAPVSTRSEPGMGELVGRACALAMASRAIHGDFSAPAALELLYGPYDSKTRSATWTDAAVPKDLPWRENLMASAGDALSVSNTASFDFSEGGKQKKIFVTNAVPTNGGCHACTGLLGMATFAKDGSDWRLESNDPYVASMGAMGLVGDKFNWMPTGDKRFALVVDGDDMHQGYQTASTSVFQRGDDGKLRQVISEADTGTADDETVSVETSFVRGNDTQHYDAKVTFTYSVPGQKTYVANRVYHFVDGKYVLVRKDDPPRFVRPAVQTEADSSRGLSASTAFAVSESSAFGATCSTSYACMELMLSAAKSEDLPAAMAAATSMSLLPRPSRGDRSTARKLNGEGLSAMSASDAVAAVRSFSEAVSADPGDEEIQSNLAYAYSTVGSFNQSIASSATALTLNPRRTSVWAPLAVTFIKMHDRTRALEAMWLAYQFSADKQKTLSFLDTKLSTETEPDVARLYADSAAWFSQNKRPEGL